MYMIPARGPQSVSKTSLPPYLGASFASETIHVVTGARLTCTCYSIAWGLPRAKLGPCFANEPIIGFIGAGVLPFPVLLRPPPRPLIHMYICISIHVYMYM